MKIRKRLTALLLITIMIFSVGVVSNAALSSSSDTYQLRFTEDLYYIDATGYVYVEAHLYDSNNQIVNDPGLQIQYFMFDYRGKAYPSDTGEFFDVFDSFANTGEVCAIAYYNGLEFTEFCSVN